MRKLAFAFLLTLLPAISFAAASPSPSCKLKLSHKTTPKLPKYLRGARSDLLVHITVKPDGQVSEADVVRGTGNKEVDSSVARAMQQEWRYKPLPAECGIVEEWVSVKLEYRGAWLK